MDQDTYYEPTFEDLADRADSKNNIVVVCGAGLSYGVAPLAKYVKEGLLAAVQELAHEGVPSARQQEDEEINRDYFTLELFVSGLRHRVPSLTTPLRHLYQEIFHLDKLNRAHHSLARALGEFARAGKRATVLTANFDDGLSKALNDDDVSFRLITRANAGQVMSFDNGGPSYTRGTMNVDICAYHGTIETKAPDGSIPSGPTSMTARSLAHPFPPSLSQYVQTTLSEAELVFFIGHRGEDFYDLNIELRRAASALVPETQPQSGVTSEKLMKEPDRLCRFVCIPHLGNLETISPSYEKLFKKRGIARIRGMERNNDWCAELFDKISKRSTSRHHAPLQGQTPTANKPKATPHEEQTEAQAILDIKQKLLVHVKDHLRTHGGDISIMQGQCAALLDDLRHATLAAWTVIEHYRLESIGYTQEEIAAFGRPHPDATYHGVKISELIKLQREYQSFRKAFNDNDSAIPGPTFNIIRDGLSLADQLEKIAVRARRGATRAKTGTQKAIALLLAAIPYDYCGLIGIRLERIFHVPPIPPDDTVSPLESPLNELLRRIDATSMAALSAQAGTEITSGSSDKSKNGIGLRTELLFRVSSALATQAGEELAIETTKFYSDPSEQAQYAANLAEIVGWQDWEFAPTENRLRLEVLPVEARLDGYKMMIRRRMERMNKEIADAAAAESELAFSAAADAAQCAVRLCEVTRLISGVEGDFGAIPPGMKYDTLSPKSREILSEIPGQARQCIAVAAQTSSIKNHLIMQAYDALLLESLLTGRGDEQRIVTEAEAYTKGVSPGFEFQYERRLNGMKSRLRGPWWIRWLKFWA